MADVFFSTNPADWEQLEGLYISEQKSPGQINGVNLNVIGVAGKAVRGPSAPKLITSMSRFLEVYGGRSVNNDKADPLYGEVWRALVNKPVGRFWVRRVYASDAVAASSILETVAGGGGTVVVKVAASSPGTWANGSRLKIKVEAPTDGVSGKWNLRVSYLGQEIVYENLDTRTGTDNLLAVVGEDDANWVVLTKQGDGTPVTTGMAGLDADGFLDVGETVASFTMVAGTDGTLADTDYNTAITDLAAVKGVAAAFVAEASTDQETLNNTIVGLAPDVADRVFLTWAGTHGQSVSTEVAQVANDITTTSDRIIWCFNSAKILDPATGLKIDSPPHHWMASIISQTDVDVHPGSVEETKGMLAKVLELRNESLQRGDLITLREAGVCALEKLEDGFAFHSGVCTDGSEITTRRSRDFLQLSAASRLKGYVKQRNTVTRLATMISELGAFCDELKDDERVIEDFEIITNITSDTEKARGLQKILWRVRLIGHILFLVLETDIATGVTISKAA
jgi:hypothetical protein